MESKRGLGQTGRIRRPRTEKEPSVVRAKGNSGCLAGRNLKREKVAEDRAV